MVKCFEGDLQHGIISICAFTPIGSETLVSARQISFLRFRYNLQIDQ